MKKILEAGIVLLLLHSIPAIGQYHVVRLDSAEIAASNWIKIHYPSYPYTITNSLLYQKMDGYPLMYELTSDSISLLMSASRACIPVIATHRLQSRALIKEYVSENLPCGLMDMMDNYVAQLEMSYINDDRILYYNAEWDTLLNLGNNYSTKTTIVTGPLLISVWGQSNSNCFIDQYAYNYDIEAGASCQHCPAGCVAVALGQVMYYWNAPLLVKELEQQFDWCNMTDMLMYSSSEEYQQHKEAIAHLLKDCGQATNTTYTCDGSSSTLEEARDALVNRYGYSSNAHHSKKKYYTTEEWKTKLKKHINWGFPVIYRGTGEKGGHAFVCDAYNNNGYFYFNWGWTDPELNSSEFSVEQLTPRDTNNYTNAQAAIFYISPINSPDLCNVTLHLEDFYENNFLLLSGIYNASEIVPQTMASLFSASLMSPASWRTISTGDTATYFAHREVFLQDGFEAQRGSDFTAEILPCSKCEGTGILPFHPNLDSLFTLLLDSLPQPDSNRDGGVYQHASPTFMQSSAVFPNPTSGELTVKTDGMAQSIIIYNTSGYPVGGWDLLALTDGWLTIDVTTLPAGPYIITVSTASGNTAARFVKK